MSLISHSRLRKLLTNQNVAFGGDFDADTRYLAPTVLSNVGLYSEVMKSEVSGKNERISS